MPFSGAHSRGWGAHVSLITDEAAYRGILDEMQDARKYRIARLGATDMDDGGVLKICGENIERAHPRIVVDRIEDFVDEHPARCVNQHARKDEALLLVVAQFVVP